MDVEMQGPPLFNFQTLLAEQGVPYYAGLPPSRNNIVDSPMQAWTDTGAITTSSDAQFMDDEDSESSVVVNCCFLDQQQFYDANASALIAFSVATKVCSVFLAPRLNLDNSSFFTMPQTMSKAMLYEMIEEKLAVVQKKSRKVSVGLGPSAARVTVKSITEENLISAIPCIASDIIPSDGVAAGQKRKMEVPSDTTLVRRSPRQNKYDGFKVHLVSDTKVIKSKVMPRKVPAVKFTAKEKGKKIQQNEEEDYAPTPVPVLQSIGVNLCGLHPSEVSSQKLLVEEVENEDSIQ
jgi:hypothetical protein